MEYEIVGYNLQLAVLQLSGGETVYAEAGAMNHMTGT
ncbi:MAG: AIM24 family protein [Methanosarcinales archaeon]|nr:AIM24 family protein [Methanosarcinales archaeon]